MLIGAYDSGGDSGAVFLFQSTQRAIPEGLNLQQYSFENLRSRNYLIFFGNICRIFGCILKSE
jgi:hypothetical protein